MSRFTNASRVFWTSMRAALWNKQSGQCYFCQRDMRPINRAHEGFHPLSPTIEHLQPVARGGGDRDVFNLALACHDCNNSKGDLTEFEFAWFIVTNGCFPSSLFRWAYSHVNGHERPGKPLPPTKLICV